MEEPQRRKQTSTSLLLVYLNRSVKSKKREEKLEQLQVTSTVDGAEPAEAEPTQCDFGRPEGVSQRIISDMFDALCGNQCVFQFT